VTRACRRYGRRIRAWCLIVNRQDLPKLQHLLNPTLSIIGCEGKKLALYNSKVVWLQDPPDECPRSCRRRPFEMTIARRQLGFGFFTSIF